MPVSGAKVNGKYPQFASIDLNINGSRYVGIVSINYSDSNERSAQRGAARQVLGWTDGEYSAEADIEFLRPHFDELVEALGDRFYDEVFPITVTQGADFESLKTDELIRCKFKSRGSDNGKGTEGLTVKVGLDLDGIVWGGRLPYEGFAR
jgi:hypothetical protein